MINLQVGFQVLATDIENKTFCFAYDSHELPGIQRVLDWVRTDFELTLGIKPQKREATADISRKRIICGCIKSAPQVMIQAKAAGIDTSSLEHKREVYLYAHTQGEESDTLWILGSDKRGTIYGLLHLSELIGVSPFVNWANVLPTRTEVCTIDACEMELSKEPSVKYRGFFINDEWPAFGNWCEKNYGGFTAEMYEKVFELLLRLKGNYLWPAMWSSIFPNDGPGLASAELADELGVVMGMSHHEPCLRQGEEYKYLRGKDSVYGDAWNFRTNREGITRFWEDGLKRSGRFDNVITVGMRGEADSTILAKSATLADNIDLLKDVLDTQMKLIRENVNSDLAQVPRMLALYKEVEPFYYGDETTQGLMGDPILDGVTLMLCDDNHGNLRTVPTEEMRSHKGGFGMYYHLDYHGLPVSYEWVNSTSLSKIWDQMCNAYDLGIRELWIVNVGDIFTNEFPLSYFLNLAYDYEKWGSTNIDSPQQYTLQFARQLFDGQMTGQQIRETADLLTGYTRIANNRRPEAMNDKVYAPFAYKEREQLTELCENLLSRADVLLKQLQGEPSNVNTVDAAVVSDEIAQSACSITLSSAAFAFYEFVYYPLTANLNLQLCWLETTYNHALAHIGASMANVVASRVREHLAFDRQLTEQLHTIHEGKWYGMGLSEHIGFRRWNEEECRKPVTYTFEPGNKARIIAVIPETGEYTEGSFWSGHPLTLPDFARYNITSTYVDLYAASDNDAGFEITDVSKGLVVEPGNGCVPGNSRVRLRVTLQQAPEDETAAMYQPTSGQSCVDWPKTVDAPDAHEKSPLSFRIRSEFMDTVIKVLSPWDDPGYISLEAAHFDRKKDTESGSFIEIPQFGKTLSGMKCLPVNIPDLFGDSGKKVEKIQIDEHRMDDNVGPYLEYYMYSNVDGTHILRVYLAPGNPPFRDNRFGFGLRVNEENIREVQAIPKDFAVKDGCEPWEKGVLDQIRIVEEPVHLHQGKNTIRLYAGTPGCTFEKLVLYPEGREPQASYLGPAETKRRL